MLFGVAVGQPLSGLPNGAALRWDFYHNSLSRERFPLFVGFSRKGLWSLEWIKREEETVKVRVPLQVYVIPVRLSARAPIWAMSVSLRYVICHVLCVSDFCWHSAPPAVVLYGLEGLDRCRPRPFVFPEAEEPQEKVFWGEWEMGLTGGRGGGGALSI